MFRTRRPARGSVVADVARQTAQAAELAAIAGQRRLADPRTNPAVRQHADRLRDEQHRRALDAEHRRALRRHRVDDRRQADAEQALQVLQRAREADSPARSVLALHRGRRAYMSVALGASVVLAGGAAMGVAQFAAELGAPRRIGYLAELGGTGLATIVISYRAHLARHGGAVTGWRNRVLWALILGPLAASIAANLAGAGLVGVLCSIGAAAFALLGHVVGEASAEALSGQAAKVTGADEAALRKVALGEDLFTPPDDPDGGTDGEAGPGEAERWVAEQGAVTAAQVARFLAGQDPPDEEGVTSSRPGPPPDDADDAALTPTTAGDGPVTGSRRIDADQPGQPAAAVDADRVAQAAAARRRKGQTTRALIAHHIAAHPDATPRQIADAVGVSVTTVRRHLDALDTDQ